jgi:hypothetical protein
MVQRVRSFPRAVLWVVFLVGLPGAGWPSQLEVAPRRVEIGAFFGGKQVVVSAEIPPLADAVVELVGEDVAETLVRKGRIGPLWMNVGEIVAQGFPTLYMVASTSSLLLAGGDGSGSWGYGKLREQARLGESGGVEESDSMLREFIKLKETQGLYKLLPVGVELVSGDERAQSIRARFPLPRCIRPIHRVRVSHPRWRSVTATADMDRSGDDGLSPIPALPGGRLSHGLWDNGRSGGHACGLWLGMVLRGRSRVALRKDWKLRALRP